MTLALEDLFLIYTYSFFLFTLYFIICSVFFCCFSPFSLNFLISPNLYLIPVFFSRERINQVSSVTKYLILLLSCQFRILYFTVQAPGLETALKPIKKFSVKLTKKKSTGLCSNSTAMVPQCFTNMHKI